MWYLQCIGVRPFAKLSDANEKSTDPSFEFIITKFYEPDLRTKKPSSSFVLVSTKIPDPVTSQLWIFQPVCDQLQKFSSCSRISLKHNLHENYLRSGIKLSHNIRLKKNYHLCFHNYLKKSLLF